MAKTDIAKQPRAKHERTNHHPSKEAAASSHEHAVRKVKHVKNVHHKEVDHQKEEKAA
ncbi:MAG TPA: hypothetical protein VJV03_10560 [Pyrinomonadaceae bacterium]|nr:hypothetical protein [Pyrinomonadaceae bacterium]